MIYIKPPYLLQYEMKMQQIEENHKREMEMIEKTSPELLKIHIECRHRNKSK